MQTRSKTGNLPLSARRSLRESDEDADVYTNVKKNVRKNLRKNLPLSVRRQLEGELPLKKQISTKEIHTNITYLGESIPVKKRELPKDIVVRLSDKTKKRDIREEKKGAIPEELIINSPSDVPPESAFSLKASQIEMKEVEGESFDKEDIGESDNMDIDVSDFGKSTVDVDIPLEKSGNSKVRYTMKMPSRFHTRSPRMSGRK